MKRVMVIGGPGSGKSTFARALGEKTGLPVFHMDLLHWKPGWVERGRGEKMAMAEEIQARECWIFEGGMSVTYPNRIARADTIVWLDLPLALRYWRVFKRWWTYRGETRPDLPENCPEKLDPEFLAYIIRSNRRVRKRHLGIKDSVTHAEFVHLRNPRDVEQYLKTLQS